ncbi:MAG: DNA polymerase III subunit gamma/tau [Patescibacteria group bacterium]
MTLYLKYRPQILADLDSQEAREALQRIVSSGKIPHAILFSGPKGIGKTSAARILAKILNCERLASSKPAPRSYKLEANYEPCNKCEQCISITNGNNLDVIEIDAASHRGIDDIRSLKEGVKLATFGGKKKVYIIDEAHMLTLEASNALLKTLEEPPEHVIFMLATTNPEKLIETIKSRTRIVEFGKAKPDEINRQLTRIVKGEKIKVEEGVLDLIARRADGSFRDAAKLFEELSLTSKVLTKRSVEEYLLSLKFFNLDDFFPLLANKKSKEALECLEKASQKAISMRFLCDRIVEKLKDSLLSLWALPGETLSGFSSDEHMILIDLFLNARA